MFSYKFYTSLVSLLLILTNQRLRTQAFDTKYDQLQNYANFFDNPDTFLKMLRSGNTTNITLPLPIMVRLQEGKKPGDKVKILVFKIDPRVLIPLAKIASASINMTNQILERVAKQKNMSRITDRAQYFRSSDELYGKSQPKMQTGLNKIIQFFRNNSDFYKRTSQTSATIQYFKRDHELYATESPDNVEVSPAAYFKSRDEIYRPPKRDSISPSKYFRSMEELYIRPREWRERKQTTQYFKTWDELYRPSKKDEKPRMNEPQNMGFAPFPLLENLSRKTGRAHIVIVDAFDLNPETILSKKRKNEIILDIQDEVLCVLNGTKNYTAELDFNGQERFPYPPNMPQPIIEIRHESWPEWESIKIQPSEEEETDAGDAVMELMENINNSTVDNGDVPIYLNITKSPP